MKKTSSQITSNIVIQREMRKHQIRNSEDNTKTEVKRKCRECLHRLVADFYPSNTEGGNNNALLE